MKKINILLILLLTALLSYGQSYTFKVLANKGVNTLANGTKITSGAQLGANETIKIVDGGYVGLIHNSGKTLELKTPGNYKVSDLTAKLAGGDQNFASKYTSFVMNKMSGEGESGANYAVTGSVDRGIADKTIKLFVPEKAKLIQNMPVVISWENVSSKKGYRFTVVNMFDQTIYQKEVTKNQIAIDLKDVRVKKGDNCLLHVVSLDDEEIQSTKVPVVIISTEEAKAVGEELKQLSNEINVESPLDNLILASFFEEKGLSLYAASSLAKASELAPEITDYDKAHSQYLASKGVQVIK